MDTLRQVYELCQRMMQDFSAGFREARSQTEVKISGEYYARSGQVLSIVFTVRKSKVITKIYDASHRLIFQGETSDNINFNERLIRFLQTSVTSY